MILSDLFVGVKVVDSLQGVEVQVPYSHLQVFVIT